MLSFPACKYSKSVIIIECPEALNEECLCLIVLVKVLRCVHPRGPSIEATFLEPRQRLDTLPTRLPTLRYTSKALALKALRRAFIGPHNQAHISRSVATGTVELLQVFYL